MCVTIYFFALEIKIVNVVNNNRQFNDNNNNQFCY